MGSGLRVLASALAAPLLLGSAAHADVLYTNTFESGTLGSEWSASARIDATNTTFTKFMGRKTNEPVRLVLPIPPEFRTAGSGSDDDDDNGGGGSDGGGGSGGGGGGSGGGGGGGTSYRVYNLTFDLYTIDSWDGNGPQGPDSFRVYVNDALKLNETFATGDGLTQSFRPADVGPVHLGFSPGWKDSIYRDISIDFTLPQGSKWLWFDFVGVNLQAMHDESWGIDNVRVSTTVVPAPGPLALAMGGVAMLRRRRR